MRTNSQLHAEDPSWVKGTAPLVTPDLEEVIRLVTKQLPQVRWEQLHVTHEGDDDGVWFFWVSGSSGEVQIEASSGACPFLIETDKHDDRITALTPRATADTVVQWLRLPGGREESPWHSN